MTSLRFLLASTLSVVVAAHVHAQWVTTNGPSTGYTYALTGSGTNLLVGTNQGIHLSSNNGTSWRVVDTTVTFVYSFASSGTSVFAGTGGSGVYRSQDNGTSWSPAGLAPFNGYSLAAQGGTLFAGTPYGVYLSTNTGVSWIPPGQLNSTPITSLAVSGTNIFAGTYGVFVWLSTDTGTTWSMLNSGLTNSRIMALASSGTNLFAGTEEGGVFLSTNNGASWSAVNNGLTNTDVRALAVSGTTLFAGTFGGVYVSTNNGTSWSAANGGLTNTDIRALVVFGTNLFAGTFGDGVWKRPLSEMPTSVQISSNEMPTRFSLHQNYPNPFNPKTTISFELPKSTRVSLKVYDILGKEVATLLDGFTEAGEKLVEFNASHFASGVYFYRLIAGDFVETKKLVLLK